MHLQLTMTWSWNLKIRKHRLHLSVETGSRSGHIKIQSVSLVNCEMMSESKNTEARTACFDDNSSWLRSGTRITNILSVTLVDHEMVFESENINAQPPCFNGNSFGLGLGNIKIPSISLVDHDMVSESKQAKSQVSSYR
uniref:Zinc finger, TAZ-type n=1 Tax=Tanacetum cinerariifolium TaxID=118510 RepID=A0A699HQA3_TANCI|nr:zinc finger, TAZ-type [Tanacetum cinerariifolium]